jgi:hypothetical protein
VAACSGDIAGGNGSDPAGEAPRGGATGDRAGATGARDDQAGAASPASPGPAGATSGGAAAAASCQAPPLRRRLWKLTPSQYSATIRALVPSMPDAGRDLVKTLQKEEGGFLGEPSRQDLSPPHVEQLYDVAEAVATEVVKPTGPLASCLGGTDAACVRTFIQTFGSGAFRRPLEPDEVTRFVAFFDKEAAALDRRFALKQVVRAVLLSPEFLYRSELGAPGKGDRFELTPYERASVLSYVLLDGPPDAELMEAARMGALGTRAQLEAQARRLLADRRQARGVATFFRELLSVDNVIGVSKDAKRFPAWNEALMSALAAEPVAFVEEVLWGEKAGFPALFSAGFTVGGKELATLYGSAVDGGRIKHGAGQRAGILTQAGLMATLAGEQDTDAILRGRFVRERFLCEELPPPPPTVNAVPPKADGVLTQRERLARHSADPTCAGCHRLMDPVGFLFEHYDAIGRYRSDELGKPVDATGFLASAAGDTRFENAVALGRHLGTLDAAQRCFVERLDSYVHGEPHDEAESCRARSLLARFKRTGGDILDAFLAAITDHDFVTRTN